MPVFGALLVPCVECPAPLNWVIHYLSGVENQYILLAWNYVIRIVTGNADAVRCWELLVKLVKSVLIYI